MVNNFQKHNHKVPPQPCINLTNETSSASATSKYYIVKRESRPALKDILKAML